MWCTGGQSHLGFDGESSSVVDNALAYPADGLLCPRGPVAEDSQGWRMHSSLTNTIDTLREGRCVGVGVGVQWGEGK